VVLGYNCKKKYVFLIKMRLLEGKKGLILGVANHHSLAWGIAKAAAAEGAQLAFSYQSEILEKRVRPLADSVGSDFVLPLNVNQPSEIDAFFQAIEEKWGTLDFLVHGIAFSDKEELRGRFLETSRDNFLNTLDISCYSLISVVQRAEKLMTDGGSILTLSYYGAEKVVPHYNVMGVAKAALECSVRYLAEDLGKNNIRVNAISAGPIKTLAASGIGDFNYILKWNQYNSPLRRSVTLEDVGGSALYLLSHLSSGVTGEVIHVDSGYHVVGMKAIDAPDLTLP
jgi:enoyl-[acyl-carrier protein] reductase I